MENRAYLHMLLLDKEPEFLVALELAMTLVEGELTGEAPCAPADLRSRLDLRVRQAV